jgi:hypothetical protein
MGGLLCLNKHHCLSITFPAGNYTIAGKAALNNYHYAGVKNIHLSGSNLQLPG